MEPWRIGTTDNAIALEFVQAGERTETVDMLLLSSVFHQPVGRYSGRIRPPEGETVELAGIAGVAEDHVAKW